MAQHPRDWQIVASSSCAVPKRQEPVEQVDAASELSNFELHVPTRRDAWPTADSRAQ